MRKVSNSRNHFRVAHWLLSAGLGDTTAVSSLQDKAGELQNTPDPGIFRIVADATSPIDETACVLDSSQDAAGCFNADHGSGSNPGNSM